MGIRYLGTAPALLKKIVCHEKISDGAVPEPSSPIERCVRHTFIALSDTPLRNRKRTFLLYPHALSVFVTGNGTDTIGVDILTPRHI